MRAGECTISGWRDLATVGGVWIWLDERDTVVTGLAVDTDSKMYIWYCCAFGFENDEWVIPFLPCPAGQKSIQL